MHRITFDHSEPQRERLINYALRHGFLLENPRKRMTETDKRQAEEYAIYRLVEKVAGDKE